MIELNVMPYCENCPDFTPISECTTTNLYHGELGCIIKELKFDHIVSCTNREKCKCIYEHVKKELNIGNGGNKNDQKQMDAM